MDPVVVGPVQPFRARLLAQLERQPRVGDDVGRRRVDEVFRREHLARAGVVALAVASDQIGPRDAAGRVLGMEIERQPRDPSTELVL